MSAGSKIETFAGFITRRVANPRGDPGEVLYTASLVNAGGLSIGWLGTTDDDAARSCNKAWLDIVVRTEGAIRTVLSAKACPGPDSRDRVDGREIIDFGYLQEANRRFFHPLGLALCAHMGDEGAVERWSFVDRRDDPEGIVFASLTSAEDAEKAERVDRAQGDKSRARVERFGTTVQPIGSRPEPDVG